MATANEKKAQFTAVRDEARTVGAQLVVQAQGNVTAARVIAGEAHAWLCDVDPAFVPAAVLSLAPATAPMMYDPVDGLPIIPEGVAQDEAEFWRGEAERLVPELAAMTLDRDGTLRQLDLSQAEVADLRVALERSEAECERRGNAGATDRERLIDAKEKLQEAAATIAKLEAKIAKLEAAAPAVAPVAAPATVAPRVSPAAAYDAAMRAPAAVAPAVDGGPVRPASVDAARWEAMSPAMRAFVAKSAK